MQQGSRIKPVVARAEGWFAVFGRNGVMPGVPEVKFMGVLTVYVLEGEREYKKKRKKDYFFSWHLRVFFSFKIIP